MPTEINGDVLLSYSMHAQDIAIIKSVIAMLNSCDSWNKHIVVGMKELQMALLDISKEKEAIEIVSVGRGLE